LPLNGLIIRIENLGDVFCHYLFVDGTVVVTHVELLKVEGLRCFRLPKTQGIGRVDLISKDWHIMRDSPDYLDRNPAHPIAALIVAVSFCVTAKVHLNDRFWTREFPGVAQAQPFVCTFNLPTITNLLIEDAEFVPDAVADCRNFQG